MTIVLYKKLFYITKLKLVIRKSHDNLISMRSKEKEYKMQELLNKIESEKKSSQLKKYMMSCCANNTDRPNNY